MATDNASQNNPRGGGTGTADLKTSGFSQMDEQDPQDGYLVGCRHFPTSATCRRPALPETRFSTATVSDSAIQHAVRRISTFASVRIAYFLAQ